MIKVMDDCLQALDILKHFPDNLLDLSLSIS